MLEREVESRVISAVSPECIVTSFRYEESVFFQRYITLVLLGVAFHLSGCCAPGELHCGSLGKPRYPTVPIPSEAHDIQKQVQSGGSVHVTTFTTAKTPQDIHAFYREALLNSGWEFERTHPDGSQVFGYVNGAGNPAFSLGVITVMNSSGQTWVTVRMIMSGPFSPAEWPEE